MQFRRPKSWLYVWHVCILTLACFGLALGLIWISQNISETADRNVSVDDQRVDEPDEAYLDPLKLTPLTNETVYAGRDVDSLQLDPDLVWTMVATGDIIPARGVDYQVRRNGPDYPFSGQGIVELLSGADLTIADLEAPLLANCPVHNEGFTFCGQASFAAALARAGVDMVSLENNHIGNYGQAGIEETKRLLGEQNIAWSTKSQVATTELAGLKIGHIAFNGIASLSMRNQGVLDLIAKAKQEVDFLIVSAHWGKEYQLVPTSDAGVAQDDPLVLGPEMIDAGADFIIGNHSHWVQGVEMYKDKLISYGHGNFIFDQSWSLDTSQGVVGRYTFYGAQLLSVEFVPVQILNQAQPVLLTGDAKERVLNRMKESTKGILDKRR